MMTTLYRLLLCVFRLFVPLYLWIRTKQGKEIPGRLNERYGIASGTAPIARPEGVVFWLNAASIGEAVSALVLAQALVRHMAERGQRGTILLTSGTVTSAEIIANRAHEFGLEGHLIHQFRPLDCGVYIKRFLHHWRPQYAIFVESDIWPNTIIEAHARGIPLALVSASLSPKSAQLWGGIGKGLAQRIFPLFDLILTADDSNAERFLALPHKDKAIITTGAMKFNTPPLPPVVELTQNLTQTANGRMIIALISSHEGEEALFTQAIQTLEDNRFFAIIAPRHPHRGEAVEKHIKGEGYSVGRRSYQQTADVTQDFWINDSLGEIGGIIRAADIIVLGGGFIPLGGHNPMEVASLGKGVISGVHIQKNKQAFAQLEHHNGVIFAESTAELADTIANLANSPSRIDTFNKNALRAAKTMSGSADKTAKILLRHWDRVRR